MGEVHKLVYGRVNAEGCRRCNNAAFSPHWKSSAPRLFIRIVTGCPVALCDVRYPSVTICHHLRSSDYVRDPTKKVGRIAQSIQRLATGWTVRGSNSGGGEIFCTRPDRP